MFPKEGLGWDLEATAIMKATKKMDAAQKLMDWAVERRGEGAVREELRDRRGCPAMPKPLPNVPADYEKRLVKNDFAWAAKNRDRILAEWSKRYDAKSEPK